MRASPGSLRWLMGKQAAWQWRSLTGGQQKGLLTALAATALITLGLYLSLRGPLQHLHLQLGGPLPSGTYPLLLLGQAFLLSVMISAAVTAALEALFTRGDLDLLLHAPISPRSVLISRSLSAVIAAALAPALLVLPLLLLLLILGVWRGLGLLVWWAAAALLAASLGLGLTLGLVHFLGVRRTRTAASVIGALFGAGLFLASQAGNFIHPRGQDFDLDHMVLNNLVPGAGFLPPAASPLWYPVRAAWLEPLPTLAVLGGSALIFWLTVSGLTRQFTRGAQQIAEADTRRSAQSLGIQHPSGQTLKFAAGSRAILFKEWRLLRRDPELLSRTLLQVVYLLPLMFTVSQGNLHGAVGGGAALLSANLASNLARITLDAEDAPDLLVSAPHSASALRRGKWLAAVIPAALLGALAWAGLFARGALQKAFGGGLCLLPLILLGTGGAALMVLWRPLPVRRADTFKKRQGQTLGQAALSFLFQVLLSAAAFALSSGKSWGLLPLLLALGVLGAAYQGRKSDAG